MNKHARKFDAFLADNPDWVPFVSLIINPPSASDIIARFPDAEGSDVLRIKDYRIDEFITVYGLYMRIRLEGETHKWAEMLALRSPPAIQTDSTYFAGAKRLGDEMHPAQLDAYVQIARKHGYNPSPSDIYNPMIADFPGDPAAFVSHAAGRSHVEKVAKARGRQLIRNGKEIVKAREPERDPYEQAPKLAPDLIAENGRRLLRENPALRKKKPQEIREMVLAKHGPSS